MLFSQHPSSSYLNNLNLNQTHVDLVLDERRTTMINDNVQCAGTFNIAFYYAYAYAHVTHGRAHAARAPCNARRARGLASYRPIAGGNQTSTLETRARTWNDQAKRTYYL